MYMGSRKFLHIYAWIHTWGPEGLKWALEDLCIPVGHTWAKMYVCRRVKDKCSAEYVYVCERDKRMLCFLQVLLDESFLCLDGYMGTRLTKDCKCMPLGAAE